MNYISDILYWISTGLLVPVIVLLIILFVRSLLLIGGFFGQYLSMKKTTAALKKLFDGLTPDQVKHLNEHLSKQPSNVLINYIIRVLDVADSPAHVRRLVSEYEVWADKDLSVSKTLAKLGPMLGLMGTLIPMGPALVGLSTGDISSMAYNMQVAFATTVVGLFSSAVGFITQQVKQRWYVQGINSLEFIEALILESMHVSDVSSQR